MDDGHRLRIGAGPLAGALAGAAWSRGGSCARPFADGLAA